MNLPICENKTLAKFFFTVPVLYICPVSLRKSHSTVGFRSDVNAIVMFDLPDGTRAFASIKRGWMWKAEAAIFGGSVGFI